MRDDIADLQAAEKESLTGLRLLAMPLLAWYAHSARTLPWRSDPTPYRVWVSEIMLQQTRVETVIPYFERFIAALPDIPSLAEAQEGALMKLWEGLGYYGRARNLQKAARILMERFGGELPSSPEELKKMPGIGDYTAGAVASIAFNRPAEAVDGNVLRVLSRLLASREDIGAPSTVLRLRAVARGMLPMDRPGDFNQALMELGATVCLPGGSPLCGVCPLVFGCAGFCAGIQGTLPVKSPKKPRTMKQITVIIIKDKDRFLLVRRKSKGLLAGLWGPVVVDGWLDEKTASEWVRKNGVVQSIHRVDDSRHIFTHLEWHMQGWLVEADGFMHEEEAFWVESEDVKKYTIPRAFKAYIKYMKK
jgi:A/G-specific adenine glycosylase